MGWLHHCAPYGQDQVFGDCAGRWWLYVLSGVPFVHVALPSHQLRQMHLQAIIAADFAC